MPAGEAPAAAQRLFVQAGGAILADSGAICGCVLVEGSVAQLDQRLVKDRLHLGFRLQVHVSVGNVVFDDQSATGGGRPIDVGTKDNGRRFRRMHVVLLFL